MLLPPQHHSDFSPQPPRPVVPQLAPPKIPEGERVDFDVSGGHRGAVMGVGRGREGVVLGLGRGRRGLFWGWVLLWG